LHSRKYGFPFCSDVDKSDLAQRTAGFCLSDIGSLLQRAFNCLVAKQLPVVGGARVEGQLKLDVKCLEEALAQMQDLLADSIGAPKIPNVKWADVG
jgi:peroxin-6